MWTIDVSVRVARAVMLVGSVLLVTPALRAAGPSTPAPSSQQGSKALNPQPEVPSKPSATDGRSVKAPLKVAPRPSDTTSPKALNPQPEVPSKAHKKLPKKKPAETA